MKSVSININSIENVKKFVNILAQYDCNMDLKSDHYVVDAKSILGIFSLDLANNIILEVEDDAEADKVFDSIKDFIV